MPAKSHHQEIAARMALAAKHRDLPMSKLHASSRAMSQMPEKSLQHFTHMANAGIVPQGTIPSEGLGAKPSGLPLDFYRLQQQKSFGPNVPYYPTDHFSTPPDPRYYVPPSPQEKQLHQNNPEQFGSPIAGLLHSDVPGRTDQLPISVEPGAYVIPADVVSGMGQGNTTAGATLLAQVLPQQGRAEGGSVVPIVAAGGEYVVPPSVVKRIGGGDLRKGQDILDKMVRKIRMTVAKQMMKLPGPRRD